ncbi:TPA: hypothetical protein O8U20_003113 [Enterobacter cloacae]|uniref:hypothetical protein n=1 Tax=Escherichia coli TaxID=562 RepID=UPI000DA532C2|nr:hypothetical protein [Escherichia coli]HCB4668676.1 hypothetical protein [Enterobacter cloacae]EIA4234840.1 hypothetical protein [Escherichia coli]SQL30120.1 Uncharacterised protein [Escherichia coli]SQL76128.1 Uncharacterised protein [Escherichia coli]HAJ7427486.1 hypothetical protein [Escherichia coli]
MTAELAQYIILAIAILTVYCPVVLTCMLADWLLRRYGIVSKEQQINGFIVGNILFVFVAPMFLNMNM